jgi:hypothetical protein
VASSELAVGTVVGSGTDATLNVGGTTLDTEWAPGYTPAEGDIVRVLIVGGLATVIAKLGTSVVDADTGVKTPPPPQPKPTTGVLTVTAGWSGSWRPGYSLFQSGDVKQGAYGGGVENEGVWGGYSQAKLKSLQGKTITKVQLRIGKRLRIGNYNSSLTLKVYHSSSTGKNPNTTDGPYDESIPANADARWITLSDSFGNALKDGGSVSIQGGSYGGVEGRSDYGASGTLRFYWKD